MEIKVNVEQILEVYKQKVAELEHELILQKVVNDSLKVKINELITQIKAHDNEEGEWCMKVYVAEVNK